MLHWLFLSHTAAFTRLWVTYSHSVCKVYIKCHYCMLPNAFYPVLHTQHYYGKPASAWICCCRLLIGCPSSLSDRISEPSAFYSYCLRKGRLKLHPNVTKTPITSAMREATADIRSTFSQVPFDWIALEVAPAPSSHSKHDLDSSWEHD